MKIPKRIERAIEEASIHFEIAVKHSHEIRKWLEERGIGNDTTFDMLIDCIEEGAGDGEEFKEFIESHTKKELTQENSLF
ncbi:MULTISPECIES: hypothetical protein [Bacillus subtilis group]|uniref:hypothetical protein n=1 Tax=Bacillus TaxID=1386 RepID=UPI000E513732|nr:MULTISPECIES: hypothetical protein [Bacillus subtilis group]MBT3123303.1 hypothetical protein [Bacillus inaquosorum]MCB4338886.1 hypothetical protein [Bacillus subtilis]MCB5337228.1 hypothetical protein [Bacillus amyloliquefaciens]MCF7615549.1 hypothetical protein [Bacillus subtilis]QWK35210.1 hypothetical protein KM843_20095 [Bacillus velezensis]